MSRFALLSTATLLTLAACGDSVSAPVAAEPPDARRSAEPPDARASGDLMNTGPIGRDPGITVTFQVSNGYSAVAGTTVQFKNNLGFAKTIADNGAGDADARAGYYSVNMPKGAASHTATVTVMPDDFSPDVKSKTVSYYNTPTLVAMGWLTLAEKPALIITMYHNNAIVTGHALTITGPNGFSKTVVDGGQGDEGIGGQGAKDGKITVSVPSLASYKVCAASSPAFGWGGCTNGYTLSYDTAFMFDFHYKQEWVVVGLP